MDANSMELGFAVTSKQFFLISKLYISVMEFTTFTSKSVSPILFILTKRPVNPHLENPAKLLEVNNHRIKQNQQIINTQPRPLQLKCSLGNIKIHVLSLP